MESWMRGDIYDENNIRIINIDSSGNMTFLLCGYMNRGKPEGECGVAVYTYDAATTNYPGAALCGNTGSILPAG